MHLVVFFFAAVFGLAVTAANARHYKAGSLDISDPWSRATPKGSTVAAGYMKIKNSGSTPDRLLSGSSEAASRFGGLEIKPGDTVELKPGSFHVMFVGLKKPLSAGDHVTATLVFEKAGTVTVEYDVLAMGAEPARDMPGMKMRGQ